jgi:putative ABC transport system ATP-binding protein
VIRRSGHLVELEHGLVRAKSRARPEHFAARAARVSGAPAAPNEPRGSGIIRLQARSVRKTYRRGSEEVHAVRDASFDVLGGELIGLVGRSGSGKTTLVNIAAGWERADGGRLSVVGADPARHTPTWEDVAVLPQQLGMIAELTIRENVEYPVRLAGRLPELSWFIEELIAGLARALVLSPRLLLADEPTGHQNAEWAEAMFGALREATSQGTACLAASHDESLFAYADRVLGMSDGILEAVSTGA